MLEPHGLRGDADRVDEDITEDVAAAIVQLAAADPDLMARHPVMDSVLNCCKPYDNRLIVLGARPRAEGKSKVNTFMQPSPGNPIVEVWKRYWSDEN